MMNSDQRHNSDPVRPHVGPVDYDAELQLHTEALRRAYGIRPRDHVLDIGCGTGQTTRDAGRLAVAGSALGVDISAPMIERARQLTKAAGLHNVHFEQGDAEKHRFPTDRFDVAISRFGTMFFADPVAAFANIGRALRPEGLLVMMVWSEHLQNEWSVSIQRALTAETPMPVATPAAPDPFSLADPTTTEKILGMAGFVDASFTDVREPVYYGPDVAAALEWIRRFSFVDGVLQQLDPASTERILERLRSTLAAHAGREGVRFDSRAWIVAARRR
jgi:SAM-dependent methyltransferase